MLSLYINKETDMFYLRNLTPLCKKKDSQYMGKMINNGMFNLSRHYSIISETKICYIILLQIQQNNTPFLNIKFKLNFIPENIYEQINLITFTSFGWKNRKKIYGLWGYSMFGDLGTCVRRAQSVPSTAVSLVYCFGCS